MWVERVHVCLSTEATRRVSSGPGQVSMKMKMLHLKKSTRIFRLIQSQIEFSLMKRSISIIVSLQLAPWRSTSSTFRRQVRCCHFAHLPSSSPRYQASSLVRRNNESVFQWRACWSSSSGGWVITTKILRSRYYSPPPPSLLTLQL